MNKFEENVKTIQRLKNGMETLIAFVFSSKELSEDFKKYYGAPVDFSTLKTQKSAISYIFSRKVNSVSLAEFFTQCNPNFSDVDVMTSLKNVFYSVFEIKKSLPEKMIVNCLVNEKDYELFYFDKASNYRNFTSGYVYCGICTLDGISVMCDFRGWTGIDKKTEAIKYAVTKLVKNPFMLFEDNKEKLKEVKSNIKNLHEKFLSFFEKDEVITTNKYADNLINLFNDVCETGNVKMKSKISKYEKIPKKYEYFVPQSGADSEGETFSAEKREYDVAIIFEETAGLYAIPFYATFCKIFENDEFEVTQNIKDCVNYFLTNKQIPYSVIKRVKDKYPCFLKRLSEITGQKMTLKFLSEHCKDKKAPNNLIAPATALYFSRVFANLMSNRIKAEENMKFLDKTEFPDNIGRNDLCPCGSGKKFKKCCLPKLEALKNYR